MALPGGDPIAAALAAGETPSPEMVAASQELEGFALRTAVLCVLLVVVSAVVIGRYEFFGRLVRTARLDLPPEALAYRAQEMLRQFGYDQTPADTAYGITCCDADNLRRANEQSPAERDAILASHRPPVLRFWYRQHTGLFFEPPGFARGAARFAGLDFDFPPNTTPGMIRVLLDPKGRLLALEAQSTNAAADSAARPAAADWPALFTAAGLDIGGFAVATPSQLPRVPFDVRTAWVAQGNRSGTEPARVEAAAWNGRVVYFSIDHEYDTAVSGNVTSLNRRPSYQSSSRWWPSLVSSGWPWPSTTCAPDEAIAREHSVLRRSSLWRTWRVGCWSPITCRTRGSW